MNPSIKSNGMAKCSAGRGAAIDKAVPKTYAADSGGSR